MAPARILVLGATGGTGRHVVEQAVANGYDVSVIVRNHHASAQFPKQVRVLGGDFLADPSVLHSTLGAQDVVISTLGVGKSFKSNGLISRAAPIIVAAMQQSGVKRLIFTSAFGIGPTRQDTPLVPRIFMATLLRDIYADKEIGERAITMSTLDWTIAYPVGLTDGPMTGKYRTGEHIALSGFPRISRADVAQFLVRQISDKTFIRKSVLIAP